MGGYGRGELYPHSDVDLLILLPQAPSADDEAAIERLVAALWDLGLEPGHSVRTIEDCQREAEADITVETAMLESRWLAGSRALMKKFDAATKARLDPRLLPRQARRDAAASRPLPGHALRAGAELQGNRPAACATCRSSCGWRARPASATTGARWPRPAC